MVQKLSMLVVDDEPNVCITLAMIFQKEGYSVKSAYSAAEAIKLLKTKDKFDVVLTDLNMEHEDAGLEVAREARKLCPPPLLVILTGYASMDNARAAMDMRVDHFAMKPVELAELLEAVRRLVGLRSDARRLGA